MKPALRLHVGINPLGQLYWHVRRGRHSTLFYDSPAAACMAAALTLNCGPSR